MTPEQRAELVRAYRLEIKQSASRRRTRGVGGIDANIASFERADRPRRIVNVARRAAQHGADRAARMGGIVVEGELALYRQRSLEQTRRVNRREMTRIAEHGYDIRPDFVAGWQRLRDRQTSTMMRAVAGRGRDRWRGGVAEIGRDLRAAHPAPALTPLSLLESDPTEYRAPRRQVRGTISYRERGRTVTRPTRQDRYEPPRPRQSEAPARTHTLDQSPTDYTPPERRPRR